MADALVELEVGAPAAGGSCVARHEGRVVFVRHALPGERVRARITEDRGRFARADALEIVTASPDRVEPPCPYAGPGRCGGCDWQHASASVQRAMKAAIVREQFTRLAGLDVADLLVEELPGGLLGWRTRTVYAVDGRGHPGLHRHRSADLEHIDRCLIGAPGVGDAPVLMQRWPGLTGVEAARGDGPDTAWLAHRPGPGRQARGRRPPDVVDHRGGPAVLRHTSLGREFRVAAGGFWQVHPAAADTLAAALLDAVRPAPGEHAVDLYAGAGAFTAALAEAVGPGGRVVGLEVSVQAVADAAENLADLPWAEVRAGRVDPAALAELGPAIDVVVLDPPRAGVGAPGMCAILDLAPRVVGYVSCDPATLARDVRTAVDHGWRLAGLRAFDAFPMTAHVECVATLQPHRGPTAP